MAVKAADFLRWVLDGTKPDENRPDDEYIPSNSLAGQLKILDEEEDEDRSYKPPAVTAQAGIEIDRTARPCHILYKLDNEYRGQNTGQRPTRDFTLDGSIIRARRYWIEIHHYFSDEGMDHVFPNHAVARILEKASEHLYNRIGHHGEVIYDFDEIGKSQIKAVKPVRYMSRISVIDIPPLVEVTIPA